ncbi:MAG TPA: aminotransferase class I/II-fold pyridoxal phosphate-dependent enzyme [Dehalococcoidia bacterium]|nr:aminotransferase class I/II-fold pyridoxal phosphate-dependent enzyme [Dehalococcoidia bacterium]
MTAKTRQQTYLAQRVQNMPASGIRRFFDLLGSIDGVISLGVGEPDFVTPWHIRDAAIRSLERGHTHYTSNYGLPELRSALAAKLAELYGVRFDPASELLITAGVSEGLQLALSALLDPDDEVLCPDPYYVAYRPCTELAGGKFVPVPTEMENDFKVRAADLERRVTDRTKVILLGYPANPTGAVLELEDLKAIAALASEHDLVVVADEIYDRLTYGTKHVPFASLPGMRTRTVTLGGLSKAYAMTGWRVGWIAAPPELVEGMMKVHQYVMMSAPTPAQHAAIEALKYGEEDVRQMVAQYNLRRRMMVDGFNDMGLLCFEPRGAFFAFPSVRSTGLSDEDFAERLLLEERVAVVPGSAFGDGGRGHVRACYAASTDEIDEALRRIKAFVDRC